MPVFSWLSGYEGSAMGTALTYETRREGSAAEWTYLAGDLMGDQVRTG